jgi:hypothetical protein
MLAQFFGAPFAAEPPLESLGRPAAYVRILTHQATHILSAIVNHAPALCRFLQSSREP